MRTAANSFKKLIPGALCAATVSVLMLGVLPQNATADGNLSDYQAVPPLITNLGAGDKPNVLVVFDNSNSMDENATGAAVGSANSSSKSEIARSAVKTLISTFNGKIRMGLMAYQQDSMSNYQLHNSFYDISFDPANYDDEFTGARDSTTKRYRDPKPSPSSEYVYYNVALPFYSASRQETAYCYSDTASFDNGSESYPSGPWDRYRCYRSKTGTSDVLPAADGSDAGAYGWSTQLSDKRFTPTDSDLAQSILDFGRFMAWKPVGDTWFVNTSPGKGYLHTPIADLDSTQATALNKKLATSQFSTNKPVDPDYPLQNAGLTPLAGTLDTARRYFTGGTLESSEGGPAPAIPTNSCGSNDFVVLVTDGLPSTDSNGNPYATTQDGIDDVAAKAAALNSSGVKVYVVGFALPSTVDQTLLDQIASAGGTASAYYADDPDTLSSALNGIFQDIMSRTSSASNAAIVANNNSGEGALYQALYNPSISYTNPVTGVSRTVTWTGTLHAMFLDAGGHLREDSNGNKQLDDYSTDKIISLTYVPAEGRTKLRRYNTSSATSAGGLTFAEEVPLSELKPIWDARNGLGELQNSTIGTQRGYATAVSNSGASRYIFTWIDNDPSGTAGVVDSTEVLDFTAEGASDTLNSANYRYLSVADWSAAQDLINFVRGKEGITGFRSRTIDYDSDGTDEVWRLGDITHSTPAVVGIPNDGYDLLYGDYSYTAFRTHYKDRRQVTYAGANDGMLHAFNGGFWDNTNKKFLTSKTSETAHPLGAELWAYIPQALLPHLKWLADPDYPHVYYVDGPPMVFDANIFPVDSDHPNGWGTVLVVGLRFGGGPFTVDSDGDGTVTPGTDETLRSSYIVMDVTNPEVPPELIAEISDPGFGFTTGKPAVVKARASSASGSWTSPSVNQWYLVFGSGPNVLNTGTSTENAKVYAYQLNHGSRGFVSGFDAYDLGLSNGFVGDPAATDWNLDFIDDAVYFGTVEGPASTPSGRLKRISLDTISATSLWSTTSVSTLINANQPFVSAPLFANDTAGRHWVYAGTGRLFSTADNTSETQQTFYGVKEPIDATGARTWGSITLSDLRDTTDIEVFPSGQISPSGLTDKAGAAVDTFNKLLADVATRDGWKIDFAAPGGGVPSSRNLSAATRFQNLLFFTSYTPNDDLCSPEGTSALWALHYQTGTAAPFEPIGSSTTVVNMAGEYAALKTIELGLGKFDTPQIHRGDGGGSGDSSDTGSDSDAATGDDGGNSLINSGSGGNLESNTFKTQGISGGRQSWREISVQ